MRRDMKEFKNYIFLLTAIVVMLIGGCRYSVEATPTPIKVPVVPNRSEIRAEVISVKRSDFPLAELTLRILESIEVSNYVNILSEGQVIVAEPRYNRDPDGNIIWDDPENIRNFVAYYLLPKDIITGLAFMRGDERGQRWFVDDLNRE